MSILSLFLRGLFRTKSQEVPSSSLMESKLSELRVAADACKEQGRGFFFAGELDQAAACYQEAIRIYPVHVESYTNLAMTYVEQRRYEEANALFTKAIHIKPDHAVAHIEQSKLSLLQGDFEKGFAQYEKGLDLLFRMDEHRYLQGGSYEQFAQKVLPHRRYVQNEEFHNKTVLVCTVLGLGDTFLLLRYMRRLKEMYQPKKLIMMCEQTLVRIVESMSVVDEVITTLDNIQDNQFDYHCSGKSLLFLTRSDKEVNYCIPYLSVPQASKEKWTKRLKDLPGLKVGLVWGGNKELVYDVMRSIPLKKLEPLLSIEGITWVSLQKGEPAAQVKELSYPILNWTEELQDMQDTAALIESLDLTISVDTSVINLVGALGRPGWLLNRYGSEWRWMLDCDFSPWYPSVRIFRQTTFKDWDSVIEKMAEELKKLINQEIAPS